MRPLARSLSFAALSLVAVSAPARADIVTLRFDLPSNLGAFGLFYGADHGSTPIAGRIAGARLIVDFNTQTGSRPFHDAAEMWFQVQLGTEAVPFWDITGHDLGWSGTGRFTATVSTDRFNGQRLINPPGAAFILWYLRLQDGYSPIQPLGGTLTASRWEFDVDTSPICGPDFNGRGGISVQDIYDFLTDWQSQVEDNGQGPILWGSADYNNNGSVTVQDLYEFFADWSAGGC